MVEAPRGACTSSGKNCTGSLGLFRGCLENNNYPNYYDSMIFAGLNFGALDGKGSCCFSAETRFRAR